MFNYSFTIHYLNLRYETTNLKLLHRSLYFNMGCGYGYCFTKFYLSFLKTNKMSTLQIEKKNAIKAFREADAKGKKLLTDLFGEKVLKGNIIELVNDFDDILELSGESTNDYKLRPNETEDELAYRQIKLIASVYNEGVILDPKNTNQYKYYPYHVINEKSGFGLSYYGCDGWVAGALIGVRLCFATRELAVDAGKKFIEIYSKLKL